MFVGDAFAEFGRRSARRRLRREAAQHELARQQALGALADAAARAGVLHPAEQQAFGQAAGQAGALAQHVAGLQTEMARLEAQRGAMIAGNAPQPQIAEVDKALYRLRGELAAKSSHSSAASAQRAAMLAQIGGAVYARGNQLPQLQPQLAQVAQIDHAMAATAQQLQASTAASAAAPKGAIGKFWGATLLVAAGGITAIAIATTKSTSTTKQPTKSDERATAPAIPDQHDTPIDAAAKRMDPVPQLTADEHVTEAGVQHVVKLYITPEAARSEGEEGGKKFVIIVRHDRHVIWVLSPDAQTYTEDQLPPDAEAELAPPAALPNGCKIDGAAEEVAGYKASRMTCEVNPGTAAKKVFEQRWAADALGGLIVKTTRGNVTMELSSIVVAPQDPALFELPAGYHP